MHVLMTCDAVGGVWTYTRELVCGLVRRGHQVSLVSFGSLPKDYQLAWMRGLSGLKYYPTDFPLEWNQDSADGVKASMDYLEQIIVTIKPDVLHSNQYCYGSMESLVPTVVVAHSDVLSWWWEVHGYAPPENDWLLWYRDIVRTGLTCADMIVAPSEWMLDALRRIYRLSGNATVVYNGRDARLFDPFSPKKNRVLSAGRVWDEGKQISLLLARRQSVPVDVAGSFQHPDKRSSVVPIFDGRNVTFLGPQSEDELVRLYARRSIYAVTSRYEPFGLAAVEAAFSRCALVVNDIPVFRELWGDTVVYFRRNDPDALANAIRTLSDDPEMCEDYGQRACRWARVHFDSQRMISEYEALYCAVACRGAVA